MTYSYCTRLVRYCIIAQVDNTTRLALKNYAKIIFKLNFK